MAVVRKREWETKSGTKQAWVVDYADRNGVRRFQTFKLKRQADQALVRITGELAEGKHTPQSTSVTFKEAAETWYRVCTANGRERATLANYRRYLDLYILPELGRHKLANLTTPRVAQFRDSLLEHTSLIQARKVLIAIKSILGEAQERGLVAQNVALPVRYKKTSTENRDAKKLEIGKDIPTKEEVRRLIDGADQLYRRNDAANARWRPFIVTLAFTGLRSSEARGLIWDNVKLEERVIQVRQRRDRYNALGKVKTKAGNRDIPLGPMVTNVLKEWYLRCPKGKSGLVFPSDADTPLMLSNIANLWWRPLQQKLGIVDKDGNPKYTLHALRHFCASYWIDLGFQPKKIQEMIGHSNIMMTYNVYGHIMPSEADLEKLTQGELSILG